jgi:ProP effector
MSHDDLVVKLVAAYPRAFFLDQVNRRPLKLQIHYDLRSDKAHGLSDAELRTALARYCQSAGYLAAMTLGAQRINLAGEPSGTVSAEAVGAAIKTARSQQEQRAQVEKKAVAVAAAPEQPIAATLKGDFKNGNAVRLSLAGLRAAAARRRQATGV